MRNIIITAGYSLVGDKITAFDADADADADVEVDLEQFSAGLGYRYGITYTTDTYGIVSYENVAIDATGNVGRENESDSGYGLALGVRSMVNKKIKLAASVEIISIDGESETAFYGIS